MQATYTDVNPTLIVNTTMQIMSLDGVPKVYCITPNENFMLHDNTYDTHEYNEDMTEIVNTILGYRTSTATCSVNYDFTANSREFYAVLRSEAKE